MCKEHDGDGSSGDESTDGSVVCEPGEVNLISTIQERLSYIAGRVGGVNKISDITGIGKSTYYAYIGGRSLPGAEGIIALCVGTGVSADWLLMGHGVPFRGEDPSGVEHQRLLGAMYSMLQAVGDRQVADHARLMTIGHQLVVGGTLRPQPPGLPTPATGVPDAGLSSAGSSPPE